jgi:phage tail sheath protein FI
MGNAQLSPGFNVEEEQPQVRSITGTQTSVLAAAGITERGPLGFKLVTGFDEFKRVYGGHTADGFLSHAVQGFFDSGGQSAVIKRVVHYTDIDDVLTLTALVGSLNLDSVTSVATAGAVLGTVVGPFALVSGDTLRISRNGGSTVTSTFTGVAAQRTAGVGPYALANNDTLTLSVDGGPVQTVTFLTSQFASISAATAAEVDAVINASVTGASAAISAGASRITSDKKGTGSSINVTGGTANVALGFTTGSVAGTGNVASIDAVTVAEVIVIVQAALPTVVVTNVAGAVKIASNTTGGGSSIHVLSSGTAQTVLGLDTATHTGTTGAPTTCLTVSGKTPGSYANDVSVLLEAATSGVAGNFNLFVEVSGVIKESWRNLSNTSTDPNYCLTIINDANSGSNLIALTQVADGLAPALGLFGPMTGGNDGLVGLTDSDFIGSSISKTGLRGFDRTTDGNILICPDRITAAVQVAMAFYCESTKKGSMFPVFSSPFGMSYQDFRTYVNTTSGLRGLTEFGAIHYPQVKVANPDTSIYGNGATIVIPPCGHIAGAYARTDNSRVGGVYQAPAGTIYGRLTNVVGFENDSTQEEAVRDLLYPDRINPLWSDGGIPAIDGCRTLKGDGNFPSVSERRGVIFIEQSLVAGLKFAKFRNNDSDLRSEIDRTINAFLHTQMKVGAFRSKVPSEAYVVDCDIPGKKLNSPSVQFAGKFYARIGLATQKPAEFFSLLVSQDTRALQAELASGG